MSGVAVLNILNSTRFAQKFRDFNWAELSDRASEAYNRQGMHLALDLMWPSVYSIKRTIELSFRHVIWRGPKFQK